LRFQLGLPRAPSHRVSIDEWAAVCGIAIFGLLREFSDQPAGIDKIATLGPFRT
jgi:hypothetical protein